MTVCLFLVALTTPLHAQYSNPPGLPAKASNPQKPKEPLALSVEIGAVVRKYVEKRLLVSGGVFPLRDGAQVLSLRMTGLHDQTVTSVATNVYVTCAEFRGTDGLNYDVDFYVQGRPGLFNVIMQPRVHIADNKPRYEWREGKNGYWTPSPVKPPPEKKAPGAPSLAPRSAP